MDQNVIFFSICIVVIAIIIIILIIPTSYISADYCDYGSFCSIINQSSYFDSLNPVDLYRRKASSCESYKLKYKQSFTNFTDTEQARLNKLTDQALKLLPVGIVNKTKSRWSYAKIGDDIELGLPHTLGNLNSGIIVSICSIPLTILSDFDLLEIICHEIIHVYQRLHESKYIELVRLLGFKPYNINFNSDTYSFLYGNYVRASNPDTWGYWAYNGLVLLSVYDQQMENTDATYNLTTRKTTIGNLDMQCNLVQQDHPFEIVAASIAKIAIGKNSEIRSEWLSIFAGFDY